MADIWAEYREDKDDTPPIMEEGVNSAVTKGKNDPWAEFRVEQKNISSPSKTDKDYTPKWLRDYLGPAEDVPSGKTFVRQWAKECQSLDMI